MKKKLLSVLVAFFLFSIANVDHYISAATTSKSESEAVSEGKKLSGQLWYINEYITNGEIEKISNKYDSFNKQIKTVEGKLAKVSNKQRKDELYKKYVKESKATKERVMYEVSEYRVLVELDKYLIAHNDEQISTGLKKVETLKKQATDIKKKKKYKALPKSISGYLNNWENHIKNKVVPTKNFPGKSIAKLITLPKSGFDRSETNKMVTRLLKINYKYLNELNSSDVEIRLIKGKLTDEPEYGYLKGVIPRGWEGTGLTWDDVPGAGGNPTMARIGYSEPGNSHGTVNLELHETAHAIDAFVLSDISGSDKFKGIQKKERKSFLPDSYFYYPEEYFAESFAYYYLSNETKETLKKKAPQTYKFISELEKKKEY